MSMINRRGVYGERGIAASGKATRVGGLMTVLATLAALPACDKKDEPSPQAAAPSVEPPAEPKSAVLSEESATPTVAKKMQDHFAWATAMKAAVIDGKLDDVTGPAKKLVESGFGTNLPEDWEAHLGDMKAAAKLAAEANDIQGAALALGHVGTACGTCHAKLGGPQLVLGEPPGEASGAKVHMQRHVWAADRMWEGLMAPAPDAWKKGSEALIQAPLSKEALVEGQSVPDEIAALAKSVHELGAKGRELTESDARASLYGQFLATCAECHGKLNVAPN
jgi:hypothetical protein